jgi:hypothetical protein
LRSMCSSKRAAAILRSARPRDRQRFLCGLSRLHSTETALSRACWMGRPIGRHLSAVFCVRPRLLVLLLDIFEIRQPSARARTTLFLAPPKKRPIGLLRHSSPRPDYSARGAPPVFFLSDPPSPALRSMRHFTVQSAMSASRLFDTSLKRLKCANSGHSRAGWQRLNSTHTIFADQSGASYKQQEAALGLAGRMAHKKGYAQALVRTIRMSQLDAPT